MVAEGRKSSRVFRTWQKRVITLEMLQAECRRLGVTLDIESWMNVSVVAPKGKVFVATGCHSISEGRMERRWTAADIRWGVWVNMKMGFKRCRWQYCSICHPIKNKNGGG